MKVFVGYPSEHRDDALDVADFIESQGHNVWIDVRNLAGGDQWDDERLIAQRNADFIIHLCSSALLTRGGPVAREVRETLRLLEYRPFGTNLALCLRIEDMRLPLELMNFHYIDMFRGDWRSDLLKSLEKRNAQLVDRTGQRPIQQITSQLGKPSMRLQKIELNESLEHLDIVQSIIQYDSNETYWRYVNAVIMSETMSSSFWAKTMLNNPPATDLSRDNPSWSKCVAEEFFRNGEVVSVRIYGHWYGSGAAHPNHGISSVNFLGSSFGLVNIRMLLENHVGCAHQIIGMCYDEVINKNTEDDGVLQPLNSLDDLKENVWDNISSFNIDKNGITFNFSPYQILAYAYGPQEVRLSWDVVMQMVSENYRAYLEKMVGEY